MKLDMTCHKCKKVALDCVAKICGMDSVTIDMSQKTLTILGDADPVEVANKLRKKFPCAILLYVGPPPKKEPPKKEKLKEEKPPPPKDKPKEEKPKEEKPKDKPKEEKPKDKPKEEKPKEDKPKKDKLKEEKEKEKEVVLIETKIGLCSCYPPCNACKCSKPCKPCTNDPCNPPCKPCTCTKHCTIQPCNPPCNACTNNPCNPPCNACTSTSTSRPDILWPTYHPACSLGEVWYVWNEEKQDSCTIC